VVVTTVATSAAVIFGALAWAGVITVWSGADGAPAEPSNLPLATTAVTTETLIDTVTSTGELSYGDEVNIAIRHEGTITSLASVGTIVGRGDTLFDIDDQPVALLYGNLPAYRDLKEGDTGNDVLQLEKNLESLGYHDFGVDDYYGWGTTAAVKKWQASIGADDTGTVNLGQVFYAPDAVRVNSHQAAVGDSAGPGTVVLTYTGSTRVVVTELKASQERLAVVDATTQLILPNGQTTSGIIAATTTVVETDQNGEAETKIQVTIAPEDPSVFSDLEYASVTVGFTAQERVDVLTVPIAALLALSAGSYGVEVVEGVTTRIVPVDTGLFANGRVEVSGDGIVDGTTVGVPQS
jgi:peptidoglycan hydrolase-like protein with peptidoglycan-binding domain